MNKFTINKSLLKHTAILLIVFFLLGLYFEISIIFFFVGLWIYAMFYQTLEILLGSVCRFQVFKQLFSIPLVHLNYGFNLPDVYNYKQKNHYCLPFEGEWLVCNGGICKNTSHSWHLPSQRYAYDFVAIDDKRKSYNIIKSDIENYYCYGRNILSVADGIVVEVGNNHSDIKNLNGEVKSPIRDLRGNYIIIKHSCDEYSLLAHLQENSIMVKVNQHVKMGEIIGKCGNSGNSSEPHLHFQLQTGKSFYLSAGLPIRFRNVVVVSKCNYMHNEFSEHYNGFIERNYLIKSKLYSSIF